MYFPNTINNPLPQGYYPQNQQQQQPFPANNFPYMPQQPIPVMPYPQAATTTGMLPLNQMSIQPYMDRQFLCKTFNFRVPYIEAFLSLSHQEKLKFFLIIQSRRLTGELTSKQEYNQLLHKISSIVNPNYMKQKQQLEYQPVSEEEIKKKLLEKQFEQKCDWELRKLVNEEQSVNSVLGKDTSFRLDDFEWSSIIEKSASQNTKQQQQQKVINPPILQNTINDQDQQFVQAQIINQLQPQQLPQSSLIIEKPPIKEEQDDQWQQAVQATTQQSKISPRLCYSSRKLDSIWDVEINEEDLKKTQPNIKEIFGIAKQQSQQIEQFGKYQQPNITKSGISYPDDDEFVDVEVTPQSITMNNHESINFTPSYEINMPKQPESQNTQFSHTEPQDELTKTKTTNQFHSSIIQNDKHGSVESFNFVHSNMNIEISNINIDVSNVNNQLSNGIIDLGLDLIGESTQNVEYEKKEELPYSEDIKQTVNNNQYVTFDLTSLNMQGFTTFANNQQHHSTNEEYNQETKNAYQLTESKDMAYNELATISFPLSGVVVTSQGVTAIQDLGQNKEQQYRQSQYSQPTQYQCQSGNVKIDENLAQDEKRADEESQQWQEGEQIVAQVINNEQQIQTITNGNVHNIEEEQEFMPVQENIPQDSTTKDEVNKLQQHEQNETVNVQVSYQNHYAEQDQKGQMFESNQSPSDQTNANPWQSIEQTLTIQQQPEPLFLNPFIPPDVLSAPRQEPTSLTNNQAINFDLLINSIPSAYASPRQSIDHTLARQRSFTTEQQPTVKSNSPVIQKQAIKIIRKITKPPCDRGLQQNLPVQLHNLASLKSTESINEYIQTPQILQKVSSNQPQQLMVKSHEVRSTVYNQHQTVKKQTIPLPKKLKLTQVSSVNIAVNSSSVMQRPHVDITPPHAFSMGGSFAYVPQNNSQLNQSHKQQKIISTFNKKLTYTPKSFTNSVKSLFNKSRTFFKSPKLTNSQSQENKPSQDGNMWQRSMIDIRGHYEDNHSCPNTTHQVNSGKHPTGNVRRYSLSQSLQMGMQQANTDYHQSSVQVDDIHTPGAQSPKRQSYNFSKKHSIQHDQQLDEGVERESKVDRILQIERKKKSMKMESLLGQLIYKLPEQEMSYVRGQLQKNMFFFDKTFYTRLNQLLKKLSLINQLPQYLKSLSPTARDDTQSINTSQQTLFSTQLLFLSQVIEKLHKIDDLNKKFTVAMEQDQQEQLAEVVFKSKQLTFEVNQDGQLTKRIAYLLVNSRVGDKMGLESHDEDDNTAQDDVDRYKGLFYLLVKLLIHPSDSTQIPSSLLSSIPQQHLHHLITTFTTSRHFSLSHQSAFLCEFITLYLLHNQLHQLQYIKNISHTIFSYLTKQHSILIEKINQIKTLSMKYAESPQVIFAKLMENAQMTNYLKGLGEMADVTDRVLDLVIRIGVRFDDHHQEFEQAKLRKVITESRQLAVKYNLLHPTSPSSSSKQSPDSSIYNTYLSLILSSTSQQHSPAQISNSVNTLLCKHPVCKVCLMPKSHSEQIEGDFISHGMVVSEQSMGSHSKIQWCHFTCYNMLKLAFEDLADSSMMA